MKSFTTTRIFFIILLVQTGVLAAQPIAFNNITVIDERDGVAKPDMTVIINGERITAVGL